MALRTATNSSSASMAPHGLTSELATRSSEASVAFNSNQIGIKGPDLPVDTATEKQAACSDRPDQSSSQVSSSQPAEPAGEVFLLQAQASPATPFNPRPTIYRVSSIPDAQTAGEGVPASQLSYSGGDA